MLLIEWIDSHSNICGFPVKSPEGQRCVLYLAHTFQRFQGAQSIRVISPEEEWNWTREAPLECCFRCGEIRSAGLHCSECGVPFPLHGGSQFDKYGEAGEVWAVFDRSLAEAYLQTEDLTLTDEDAASVLSGWRHFYRGPGRAFGHEPSIRVSRTRVLVKQFRGLDI